MRSPLHPLTALIGLLAAASGGVAGAYYAIGSPVFGVIWTFIAMTWVLSTALLSKTNYYNGQLDAYRDRKFIE